MNKIHIDPAHAGKRADVLATEQLPKLSRAFVHKLFQKGDIKLNDNNVKPGYKLRIGDTLTIDFDEASVDTIPSIELPVLYEDEQVLVINKPAGVISHSRGKFWNEPSVASFIRQRTGQEGDRAGIVHRLDRATSGVMICAKNQEALKWLQRQFSGRKVVKTYYAVIDGRIDPQEAVIDMPIERNPKAPSTFRVGSNGKAAITRYKVLRTSDDYQLLELVPRTGRTHQLRVHLKHTGHPIAGDQLYGGSLQERLYLHAYSLELALPDGQKTVFTAPLPSGFNDLLI